jgi:Choline/Carnitine o-acyltransferase
VHGRYVFSIVAGAPFSVKPDGQDIPPKKGTPTASLCDWATKHLLRDPRQIYALRKGEGETPQPAEFLRWQEDDVLREEIHKAEEEFDAHVAKYDLRVGVYRRYGKDAIKKCGVSPDSWFA